MGLIQRKDEMQTEVQKRVATDLQARLRAKTSTDDFNDHEPEMLKDHHHTRPAGLIIIALIVFLVVSVVVFAVSIS